MTGVSGSEKSHSDKCKGQRWHERARETQRDIERVREKHMQASRTGQVHASIGECSPHRFKFCVSLFPGDLEKACCHFLHGVNVGCKLIFIQIIKV